MRDKVFASAFGGVGGVGLSGVPERRPDPLRWLWYTFGGGLGPSYREWALHDVISGTHLALMRRSTLDLDHGSVTEDGRDLLADDG